jgi:hypothetical protein
MKFLIQSDDVTVVEKRVIRHAAALTDAHLSVASLSSLRCGQINPDIPVDAAPVGTVEFVSAVMQSRFIATPEHFSYPDRLKKFLRRKIWEGVFGDHHEDVFIKPRHEVKAFTGSLLSNIDPRQTIAPDFPVWFSDPVKFVSEWRYYVLRGKIVGAGRYDDGDDFAAKPKINVVRAAVAKMSIAGNCPAGYALDFGVIDGTGSPALAGRTALVEANDGWALGYYKWADGDATCGFGRCSPCDYAALLYARWCQLIAA